MSKPIVRYEVREVRDGKPVLYCIGEEVFKRLQDAKKEAKAMELQGVLKFKAFKVTLEEIK